jgi:hypothetical protein
MTFLPIVARELRVASRRRATYWSRSIMAMAAIILGFIVYLNVQASSPHDAGQALFYVISVMAFIFCLATGVRSTADCLSEEKREGTLGLLFLTDLKGYDVVGGKLVATSLNAFYGLTAIFPVLAIPLLMGGVTQGEFWRMALVLANTFFFSLAIGMFMSSISRSPRKAMAGTLILVLFFSLGLEICRYCIPFIYHSPVLVRVCWPLDPGNAIYLVSDQQYVKMARDFWWSVGIIHGLCWVFLVLASLIVPRSWQDNPPGAKAIRWRDNWHRVSFGAAANRLAFRRRLLDINAFFWLAARARLKPIHVWVTLGVLTGFWIWGAVENRSDWFNGGIYIVTAIVLTTTLKVWIASEAGRRLGEDRKIGSLELLLSTPLNVRDILRGQMLALRRQFLAPMIVVLVVECVFLVASARQNRADIADLSFLITGGIAYMAMFVVDAFALSSVGMWISLTTKNPNRTTGITVFRILLMPMLLLFAILISYSFFRIAISGPEFGWKTVVGLYLGLGIATDLYFGLTAWRRLHSDFREVAVQRFTAPPSFLRRLFAGRGRQAVSLPPAPAR